jgi:mono/diheme cytochrome c family protein
MPHDLQAAARLAAAAGAVLAIATASAAAQDPAVERGRDLAATWCSSCHAIGAGTQDSALAGAPSFRSLGASGQYDVDALSAALLRPHPVMPDFPVTRRDLSAIAAYLDWVAQQEQGALDPALSTEAASAAPSRATVAEGERIVAGACADCHAIAGPGPSPVADAPPFSTLSRNYPVRYLEEALAEGIVVNHPEVNMPEFVFQPDEIAAIIAYLESVQAQ